MIISQTPLRISFFGGGTDLKEFYKESYGSVISTTIDKYIYVIIKERFDDDIYINYSSKEIVSDVNDIKHDLIREALKITGIERGIEITTLADVPSEGSGLGSSSSLTVGLLNALYTYKGELVTAEKLASEACQIEIEILLNPIGKQDQYAAAYGGLNTIVFNQDESVTVNPVAIDNHGKRILGSEMMLFYTDITRKSNSILTEQRKETKNNYQILSDMRNQVEAAKINIEQKNYIHFGKQLNAGWQMKKELASTITNPKINDMYDTAMSCGAIGGKISGAGGGGFLLLYVPREQQNSVREGMAKYRELAFMFEPFGSKINFNIMRGL